MFSLHSYPFHRDTLSPLNNSTNTPTSFQTAALHACVCVWPAEFRGRADWDCISALKRLCVGRLKGIPKRGRENASKKHAAKGIHDV